MYLLPFLTVGCVLCAVQLKVHAHNVPVIEDESILIHSLRKRDVSDDHAPMPYRQRDEEPPLPITDPSEGGDSSVFGHTAVLNPNVRQDPGSVSQANIAGSRDASLSRTQFNDQYSADSSDDNRLASYDYTHSSGTQTGSQPDPYNQPSETPSYANTGGDSSDTQGYDDQRTGRAYNNPSRTDGDDSRDGAQRGSEGSRSTGTQTDPRYTDPRYTDPRYTDPRYTDSRYQTSGSGGATATYSPTGTRRQTDQRRPTGRRPTVTASYPLGPIISTGGGEQLGSDGQPIRNTGHQPRSSGQPTYTHGGQPTQTHGGGQPVYTSGQPTYTGTRQQYRPNTGYRRTSSSGGTPYRGNTQHYRYTNVQQPVYTSGQPTGQGGGHQYGQTGYYPYGGGQYDANYGSCPETGIRMRINGMDCARAVDFYGAFLCYRHEYTSRECCQKCQPLKNPSSVGCEYGDHSYQCRDIQAHDCYDLRNRQGCCQTCDRLRTTGEAGCEYGDMTPRCERVSQNPSLCYIPENQRLCCHTCRRLRVADTGSQTCPWGDQNANLCRPFDQHGGVRINCYAEPIRRLCCQTCERLMARMPENIPGCQYGDRPVIFNTGEFGSLNCTSFFRHFPTEQCVVNQAVSINCCFTCHRYQGGARQRLGQGQVRGQVRGRGQGQRQGQRQRQGQGQGQRQRQGPSRREG